jgi:NADH-quinone oxidoreductase subunit I
MKGILKGLGVTLSTSLRKPVTIEYPDDKHALPVRQRSFPVLLWDFDHDEPFCTGCNICVRNCPVKCMTAVMHDNPKYVEGTSNRRKIVEKFWIDYARCMRCNICVEVCPFEAIVMDNNWSGHEHAVHDRRDLHLDISDLLYQSKSGNLVNPFRPQDNIEMLEREVKGEEPPERAFKGAWTSDRLAQMARLAAGKPAAIQEREPEKPKAAAPGVAPGGGPAAAEVEVLSESKIRAKRMRAEREAKAFQDRGEEVPQEVLDRIELYRSMKPGQAAAPAGSAAAPAGAGEVLTGLNPDGSMRFPPGVGDGPKGDPNSFEKCRARRTRAEKKFKELEAAGEPIPDDVAKTLYDLGSDLAPGGSIWATLAGSGGTAQASAPLTGTNPDGSMRFPPGVGDGPKGDPNSFEKCRARRTRAEKKFKELSEAGEEIPEDIAKALYELGSDLAPGGSIWATLSGGAAGAGAPTPAAAAAATGSADNWRPPAGVAIGEKGTPNSLEKLRARRMRAEKKAREAVAAGEPIPDDIMATLNELGGEIPGGAA